MPSGVPSFSNDQDQFLAATKRDRFLKVQKENFQMQGPLGMLHPIFCETVGCLRSKAPRFIESMFDSERSTNQKGPVSSQGTAVCPTSDVFL